jgi:MarR family transcriptional regulator, organic hydroperoxide resistance regulator
MARGVKKRGSSAVRAGRAHPTAPEGPAHKSLDIIRRFTWEIASINVYFEELRHFWAKALGVSGPHWMILMAVAELDHGEGVAVNAVAKTLQVDPSFVTTQSKMLENKGFMRRRTSVEDARTLRMSLTDKTHELIANLADQQNALNEFIFAEFNERELEDFTDKLTSLKIRLEKACLKVTIDI